MEHVGKGVYHEQLARWWALGFPRENFFVASLEEFQADSISVFGRLLVFLGAASTAPPTERLAAQLKERHNATKSKGEVSAALKAELGAFYAPHNEKLFKMLGRRLW